MTGPVIGRVARALHVSGLSAGTGNGSGKSLGLNNCRLDPWTSPSTIAIQKKRDYENGNNQSDGAYSPSTAHPPIESSAAPEQ
jgi:hypothetical protein